MTVGSTSAAAIGPALNASLARLDRAQLRADYVEQGEFVSVARVLPEAVIARWLQGLDRLKPHVHRNYIPRHKKGGSVPYDVLVAKAPSIAAVYHDPGFLAFLGEVAGATLRECPPDDPHRCALYAYTEEGDHIGWHYDTSYYKDRRWTVLLGLLDESSSRLECRLHTRTPGREPVDLSVRVDPGMMILFNGDMVYHRVTPSGPGEERYIVTMEYVTRTDMNPLLRFVSNMKDAIAYFGLRSVFRGGNS